jgi:repressor LexA
MSETGVVTMGTTNKPLSERQKSILAFIRQYVRENRRPPTIREIGQDVKISSTSVVNYNLTKLKEKGYLDRDAEVSRGLRLTQKALNLYGEVVTAVADTASRVMQIPLLGSIVAGEPIETYPDQNGDDVVELSSTMINGNIDDLFALRVSGDSMIDAMVNDGDIVIMRKANSARNGDMVAVWIEHDDETTLKYFFEEGDKIRLQPANPTMEPIYREKSSVQVQGKVMMVMRQTA